MILRGVFRPTIGGFSDARVDEIIEAVGLDPVEAAKRRPHEYSGGQCQRVSVARTLVLDPEIVICDEPVSALDVSVQAQILNMLEDMKERYGITLVFISHDLSVVRNVSDRLAVMYLGKMCEIGDGDLIYSKPAHPYTQVLLAACRIPRILMPGLSMPLTRSFRRRSTRQVAVGSVLVALGPRPCAPRSSQRSPKLALVTNGLPATFRSLSSTAPLGGSPRFDSCLAEPLFSSSHRVYESRTAASYISTSVGAMVARAWRRAAPPPRARLSP